MTAGGPLHSRGASAAAGSVKAAPSAASGPSKASAGSTVPRGAPPLAPPPFSVADIRRAIPAHLFERSALLGFAHLFRDLAVIAVIVAAHAALQASSAPAAAKLAAWPLYWYLAGSYMTGVWVIAHECGHQAFSASRALNDAVGLVLHSALLVPYHSWAISHGHHHANTCSLEDDEVFVPATRSEHAGLSAAVAESPLASLFGIWKMLFWGWPAYLAVNASGPRKYAGGNNSHFWPWSRLFTERQAPLIALSLLGLAAAAACLAAAVRAFGAVPVALWYGAPYLVVNAHLVLITYLQHTDEHVPHYRAPAFTWLRGALSTVDRSFGPLLDDAFHHIADSHVVHHLFHTMPFYNAVRATPYVRALLGDYYLSDDTPIPAALWRAWRSCKFVEDEGDVVFLKNGVAERAAAKRD